MANHRTLVVIFFFLCTVRSSNSECIDELTKCYAAYAGALGFKGFPPSVYDFSISLEEIYENSTAMDNICKYQETFYKCIGSSDKLITRENVACVFYATAEDAKRIVTDFYKLQYFCPLPRDRKVQFPLE